LLTRALSRHQRRRSTRRHPRDGNRNSRRRLRWRASYTPQSPGVAIEGGPVATSRAVTVAPPRVLSLESRFRLPVLDGGLLRRSFARPAAHSQWPAPPAPRRSSTTARPLPNKASRPAVGRVKQCQAPPPLRKVERARLILYQSAPPTRG